MPPLVRNTLSVESAWQSTQKLIPTLPLLHHPNIKHFNDPAGLGLVKMLQVTPLSSLGWFLSCLSSLTSGKQSLLIVRNTRKGDMLLGGRGTAKHANFDSQNSQDWSFDKTKATEATPRFQEPRYLHTLAPHPSHGSLLAQVHGSICIKQCVNSSSDLCRLLAVEVAETAFRRRPVN